MQLPKISIITPSYNQGEFIEETILSIINQNYPHLELIIVDGGSTDNTIDILRKYEEKITYWVSEKDKGTYDANNKALTKITGDYWCVVNSDDTLLPGSLMKVAEHIIQTKSKWVAGGELIIDENSNERLRQLPKRPERISGLTFLSHNWIYHPATFIHKSVIDEIGYFRNYEIMDYEYWLRMEIVGYTPSIIEDYLCGLRFHSSCKSFDYLKQYKNIIELLQFEKDYLKSIKWPSKLQELNIKLDEWRILLFKTEVLYHLFNVNRLNAIKSCLKIIYYYPSQITKRWFLGLIKRFFTQVKEEEYNPLYNIL